MRKIKKKRQTRISITLLLIIVNVIFFIITLFLGFFDPRGCEATICKYIALTPAFVGERLWTIITTMFAHASPAHLFVNMLSLFFLGAFLERLIGWKRFLIVYFVTGIVASLFFIIFAQNIYLPAVGASGAIFGLGGILAVLTPRVPVFIMFIPIPMPLWFGIVLMLGLLWLVSALAGLPIGNTAHLGGFIAGLAYGFYLRIKYRKKVAILDRYFRFRK